MSDFMTNRMHELLDLEHDAADKKPVKASKTKEPSQPPEAADRVSYNLAEYESTPLEVVEISDEQNKADKELSRAAIRDIITKTNDNLNAVFKLAKMSEHPRAFEVAATLARTVIDAATKLDDMVEGGSRKGSKGEPTIQNNTQNNFHVSSEDAMKLVREALENDAKKE